MSKKENLGATGRRKTSIAQVRLVEGQGKVTVNKTPMEEYFRGCGRYQNMVLSPVNMIEAAKKYDFIVKTNGGGIASQAGAIRHSISRVLAAMADENRKVLKKAGFLTRDPRMVERKKPGQPKARKRFQFSKR